MTTQPEALRLAEIQNREWPNPCPKEREQTADELRRLHRHELVLQDWLDKTNWVQETAQAGELGMHRADALKKRIEKLEAINQELLEALRDLMADNSDLSMTQHLALYRKARAAINKAERTTT